MKTSTADPTCASNFADITPLPFFRKSNGPIHCLTFAMVVGFILPIQADTTTWNSAVSSDFNETTNWSVGTPTDTDEALFSGTSPVSTLFMNDDVTTGNLIWNVNSSTSIRIDTTAPANVNLNLSGNGGSTAAIAAGGSAGDLLLMGTSAVNRDLTISGSTNGNGAKVFIRLQSDGNFNVVDSESSLRISASIQGNHNLTKTGQGTLELFGFNTFGSGRDFTIQEGQVNINQSNGLSTATLVMDGGNIDNRSSGGALTVAQNNDQVWNAGFSFIGSNDLDMGTGSVNLGTAAGTSRTIDVQDSRLTIGGVIADGTTANSLVKEGAGTLVLNGTNTLSGSITVNEGSLEGTGSVGSLLVADGGTLAPGENIGTMESGDLSMSAGSTFGLEINTSTVETDLLDITGNLSLESGTLLTLGDLGGDEMLTLGTELSFIDYTGTWDGGYFTYEGSELLDDQLFTFGANQFIISYNGLDNLGTSVTLTAAVPEPTIASSILLAAGLFTALRRSRSQAK